MNWFVLALLTALFYGTYNIFIKLSSPYINQVAGALILQIVAAILGALVLVYLKFAQYPIAISSKGVAYAIAAGVFVGLAEITSFYVFSKGIDTRKT